MPESHAPPLVPNRGRHLDHEDVSAVLSLHTDTFLILTFYLLDGFCDFFFFFFFKETEYFLRFIWSQLKSDRTICSNLVAQNPMLSGSAATLTARVCLRLRWSVSAFKKKNLSKLGLTL